MKVLKGYSNNPYRPEASIVKRYLVEEAIDFCKPYLKKGDDDNENLLGEDEISGVRSCDLEPTGMDTTLGWKRVEERGRPSGLSL